ncbi:MAG: GNAT family N-acetyltransferase [Anaerolineaceae bacterium]|nr:GNAT family N-acetyltransferase [Anaerolineaceae bacterium]
MYIEPKPITLKDGRSGLLRVPEAKDAQAMLEYLHATAAETHFLLREPEDIHDTLESEISLLNRMRESESQLILCAFVEGELAGNCMLALKTRSKVRHRADLAIALLQKYWGQGIGSIMFAELEAVARLHGVSQLELDFIEGNTRGQALYEKMGFHITGQKPNAFRLKDGTLLKEFSMVKEL